MTQSSESFYNFRMSVKLFLWFLHSARGRNLSHTVSIADPEIVLRIHWSEVIYFYVVRLLEIASC